MLFPKETNENLKWILSSTERERKSFHTSHPTSPIGESNLCVSDSRMTHYVFLREHFEISFFFLFCFPNAATWNGSWRGEKGKEIEPLFNALLPCYSPTNKKPPVNYFTSAGKCSYGYTVLMRKFHFLTWVLLIQDEVTPQSYLLMQFARNISIKTEPCFFVNCSDQEYQQCNG